ncbi:hypothetical protein SEA_BURLEY_90 [Gordonia phage Burley]|nr:hypothetical protein SEA_RUNHAAR_89 [Gordonia phage Runhaar]QZD97871.1 hypothetical protein SEA_NADMEG_90 [Gordonia phage Nadmeg]USH44751.1 hypothetical protein SEA_BURLEY_90 [Gordonia phage Burley]UVK64055.1 hypothetical protein SEA_VARDY_90 [Gordonia phage Vardy]
MEEYMLSTADNPFNPFTEWEQWYAFDAREGYHTPAYLARVVRTSSELSEADQIVALNDGIDEILQYNLTGNYIKVTRPPVVAT